MESQSPLQPDTENTSIFEEPLQPKKPWYKHWWLWLYFFIFTGSLVILSIFADTTTSLVDSLPLDDSSQVALFGVTAEGLTALPGQTSDSTLTPEQIQTRLALLDAPYRGATDAPVVIYEFADYQCPYCRESYPILRRLAELYPQTVKVVYVDFPITSIHPLAVEAAHAARCAGDQDAYWQYHDLLFQNQELLSSAEFLTTLAGVLKLDEDRFAGCMNSNIYKNAIESQFNLGLELGVAGTPTYFVSGYRLPGVLPYETWEQVVLLIVSDQETKNQANTEVN